MRHGMNAVERAGSSYSTSRNIATKTIRGLRVHAPLVLGNPALDLRSALPPAFVFRLPVIFAKLRPGLSS